MAKDVVFTDKDEDVSEEIVESPRGRRPGLGRKRARFSLLPTSRQSQPTMNLEQPTLDIDKLNDPEEFFMAFERLENAKKEIAKQTGRALTDSNQFNTSMSQRPRRQGLPGRFRSAKYKHLYPTMFSQETFEMEIGMPSTLCSQQSRAHPAVETQEGELEDVASHQDEPTNVAPEEAEMAVSIAKAESRVDKLLVELLARDCKELDGDGTLNILQDQLKIKSLNIENLDLPELQDIRTLDLKALGEKLPKASHVLSDIHKLLKGTTPVKHKNAESYVLSLGSLTSPLASSKFKSLMIEEDNSATSNMRLHDVAAGDFRCPSDKPVDDNLTTIPSGSNVGHNKSCAELDDNNVGMDKIATNENLSCPDTNADVQTVAPNELEERVEDMLQEGVDSPQANLNMDCHTGEMVNRLLNQFAQSSSAVIEDRAVDGCSQTQGNSPEQTLETTSEQHNEKMQEPDLVSINEQAKPKSRLNKGRKRKTLSKRQRITANPAVFEDHAMDEDHETQQNALEQMQDAPPEEHNEKVQETAVASLNVRTKSQPQKVRKDKAARKSLTGFGMSWEAGVRRSTRIRSRPLEYWKGERFLYGRIHDSLATVIGIKYESPERGTNGKPTIKVKSFVSDQHKHLVELATRE